MAARGRSIGASLRASAALVEGWLQRSRQRRALAELDDRQLRDIGVTRAQALAEAARPFWRGGKT